MMKLKSKDFTNNNNIPSEFTCEGRNVSPQSMWENVPDGTKSFALSVTDPDFSRRTWLHWLVYGISADARQIEQSSLPDGTKEIVNDFGQKSYGGPCPPSGTRRYLFTIHKLDIEGFDGLNIEKVEQHTIEKTEIMGLYKRR